MADGDVRVQAFDLDAIATALGVTKRAIEMRAKRESWLFQTRAVRGGTKRLYPLTSLPAEVQAALLLRTAPVTVRQDAGVIPTDAQIQSAWTRYEAVPQHLKALANRRLQALQAVESLVAQGHRLLDARASVAAQLQREGMRGGSVASLHRWAQAVAGIERQHRLALLVPEYTGRTASAEIPAEAWDTFKADCLRVEAPSATSCYRRLERVARVQGWALPCLRTFERRIERELPRGVLVLARQGREAFNKTFPAQERDRSIFHALEAVNADGHKFDVFVRWPDGTVARPIMVGVQDLYSGKLLGYRIAETESADLARMAFRDVIERFGIPAKVWLDNGRGFASKMLTGGTANRFRFKVRQDDPTGVLTGMGCEIHWATPYHGQAKPIERAWRDLCDTIAKHPEFAGAYTGNKPDAKPENYASKAVPLDTFVRVLNSEIGAHNAREGRTSRVAAGASFDRVFNHSYAQSPIRKASPEQLRQLLLAAEVVTADQRDGSVRLSGNRYWVEALGAHAGHKVTLRFDPDALHTHVHAYTLANVYIGQAECIAAVGFADTSAAREHARAKKQYRRAAKQQLDAERRMDIAAVAAQLPTEAPVDLPAPGVVAPLFGKARPVLVQEAEPLRATGTDDARHAAFGDLMSRLQQQKHRDLGFAPSEDEA